MAAKIYLPHKDIVIKWKEEKVIKWLKRVHLDDCIPAFEVRHIDGMKLLELSEQKLFTYQDLKIKHRKQIAKCVQECKSQASNAKRIARTIKHRHDSQLGTVDTNGEYCSGEDSDGSWGSDFEDESDEEVNSSQFCELNNNTITEASFNVAEEKSGISSSSQKNVQEQLIPKPPDVPVIPNVISGPTIKKASSHTNSIPRPPVKRPPSQPPPPPIPQVASQDIEQEDYEIPIVTTSVKKENSENSDSSFHSVISNVFIAETYELIEPPEETYEMVDAPGSASNFNEKPVLPPRLPLSCGTVSPPPPLPQKPKKLKESMLALEKPDGVRTFTRPKPLQKTEVETGTTNSSTTSSMGFIGTLIGRKSNNSSPLSASPKTLHKTSNDSTFSSSHSAMSSSDGLSSRSSSPDKDALHTVGRSSFIMTSSSTSEIKKTTPLPHLPLKSSLSTSDETVSAQNMATRPLPPVPMPKEEKILNFHQEDLQSYPWYHEIEREVAEQVVKTLNESGSFLVRPSKRAGIENPFSLTILHDEKLFHLNIRHRPDNTFALGKEKKKEKTFACVADLIAFHQTEPILLTSRGEPAGKTLLIKYPEKS